MIYLASPYSSPDPAVMQDRYERALAVAAMLTNKGQVVYSPIVHYHPMACVHDLPRDFSFWAKINFWMISRADSLYVLKLGGWQESVGVAAEIDYARKMRKQVVYLEPILRG